MPKRWVVERTLGWRNHHRRLNKYHEQLASTVETFIYIAMIRLLLRRLARTGTFQTVSKNLALLASP